MDYNRYGTRQPFAIQNKRYEKEWPLDGRDYRILDKIGEGSFASVHLAIVTNSTQMAAMKIIELNDELFKDEKWEKLCKDEVVALQKLDHPNVLKCFASFEDRNPKTRGPRLNLVLEYVQGTDLEQFIYQVYMEQHRRVPERRVWWLFSQIASAMSHVHEKRILHRDLKPANVLLSNSTMQPKVCDFGLCRLFSQHTAKAVTSNVGTPYYMSPERVDRRGYNFASDVWSLGCMLYELACGGSPFVGEHYNEYALNMRIREGDFPPLPGQRKRTEHLRLLVKLTLNVRFEERPSTNQVWRYAQKMNHFFNGAKNPFLF